MAHSDNAKSTSGTTVAIAGERRTTPAFTAIAPSNGSPASAQMVNPWVSADVPSLAAPAHDDLSMSTQLRTTGAI